jgi:AraC-like DNA-binding protein
MNGLSEVVFNVELALGIDVISAFMFAFLLFLIKVPKTEYSRKIAQTKNTIAACFMICSLLFFTCLRYSGSPLLGDGSFDEFASMMMFVITCMSSVVLSFSLINLLDEKFIESDKFYLNVGFVAVLSVVFMRSFWMDKGGWLRITVQAAYVAVFIIQCISHIIAFRKRYKNGLAKLAQYYDEDEDQKLKWIHFCYVIMMLTQMFILVYRLFPTGLMKVYNVWYSLFMLYFTANFISFLGSHKLTLDAFAYKALSGQEIAIRARERRLKTVKSSVEDVVEETPTEIEFKKIERALDQWVKQKKYVEYDKSREDIAKEMKTTREMLHLYFTTRMGVDFKTWRTNLRIEEAKKLLLKNKDISTNLAGEMAGFSDRSNFHRQFVKIVGCSPRQFRDSGGKN